VSDTEKPAESGGGSSPLRLQPPEVTRLNRNALYLVMAMGLLTVLVAVLSLQKGSSVSGGRGDSASTHTPIEVQRPVLPPIRATGPIDSSATQPATRLVPPQVEVELARRPTTPREEGGVSSVRPHRGEQRGESYQRALVRSPLIADRVDQAKNEVSGGSGQAGGGESSDADIERALIAPLLKSSATASTAPNSGQLPPVSNELFGADAGTAQRAAREHREFLTDARSVVPASLVTSVESPLSRYELQAGVVIPAALVTEINSDLPGTVVAQVSRDVYDSRIESLVLVPKGSRLVGRYDDRIVAGQSRVLVAWTRLLFPDGRSVVLPGVAATDSRGSTGLPGGVNSHLGRVFGDASVLSLLGAGAELSQPRTAANVYAAPSVGQTIGAAAGTELSSVGTEMVRQGLEAKPTIVVPAGAAVNVLLADDLVFDGAYVDARQ
jgi:type IV secretory pathway VirB10-like protein